MILAEIERLRELRDREQRERLRLEALRDSSQAKLTAERDAMAPVAKGATRCVKALQDLILYLEQNPPYYGKVVKAAPLAMKMVEGKAALKELDLALDGEEPERVL